jgi:hypothetical protein
MSTIYGCSARVDSEWTGDDPVKMQELLSHWCRILGDLENGEVLSDNAERDFNPRWWILTSLGAGGAQTAMTILTRTCASALSDTS